MYDVRPDSIKDISESLSKTLNRTRLSVDAGACGGIARFMNCCFGREKSACNVQVDVFWNTKDSVPMLCLVALRDIAANEQLIVDYGLESYCEWLHGSTQALACISTLSVN